MVFEGSLLENIGKCSNNQESTKQWKQGHFSENRVFGQLGTVRNNRQFCENHIKFSENGAILVKNRVF
jgi:hypothetical protein